MRDVEWLSYLTQKELHNIEAGTIVSCMYEPTQQYIFFKIEEAEESKRGHISAFRGMPFCPGKDVRYGEMFISIDNLRPLDVAYKSVKSEYKEAADYYLELLQEVEDIKGATEEGTEGLSDQETIHILNTQLQQEEEKNAILNRRLEKYKEEVRRLRKLISKASGESFK